jgi:hypothetical protein
MKEETFNDMDMSKMAEFLKKNRNKILEEFAKAYLAETQLLPSQIELVHKSSVENEQIVDTFYFRKKN